MGSSKFDRVFKFISEYKHEISRNAPDNLKCGKCNHILINAYCVPCGCSYCSDCVTEMLNNGVENCPGKAENCRDVLMSNNQVEYKTNIAISNIVMKCPEEMCLYECAIINMEKHVRVCEKKSVKCPFADVGCDGKKIAREMLNDHCQSDNFNHCKILIKLIDNMRNDIDILKCNDEKNQLKISNLENNLKSKDEIIDKINKEINLIKMEKETAKQEFDSFKQNLVTNKEVIDDKINRDNERMKIEKDENKREFDKLNKNLEEKTKLMFTEMQKENEKRIESINNETKSIKTITLETNKKSEMMETRINELNKIIDYFGYAMFEWTIDKLDEKKKDGKFIDGECFSGVTKQYKLQLQFYPNGSGDIKEKGYSVYFRVHSGGYDEFLSWPFTADVTIKLINKTDPKINKSITKYCKIDKPLKNSWKWSESFDYLYSDLTKVGEILDNCFIIQCFFHFK